MAQRAKIKERTQIKKKKTNPETIRERTKQLRRVMWHIRSNFRPTILEMAHVSEREKTWAVPFEMPPT